MKFRTLGFAAALLLGLGGIAAAQLSGQASNVQGIGLTDLIPIIPGGAPSGATVYARAAQIAGVPGYQYSVPLTAFSIQAANSTKRLFLNPAGTLATGTVLFALNPSDGQEFCIESTQTQTALTVTAGSGTTISALAIGAVTALVAGTPVCWFYNAPLLTWYRTI